MSRHFDLTDSAKQFAGRHPLLNFTLVQITFWAAAEVLLALIFHFMLSAFSQVFEIKDRSPLLFNRILFGAALGVIYGITFGAIDYLFEGHYFRRLSLGVTLLIKTISSFIVFLIIYAFIRFVFT